MGINVCIMIRKVSATAEDRDNGLHFEGKITLNVVDEDTRTVKVVEWFLGDATQFELAYNSIGKVSYAVVESVGGIPKLWFLPESPFSDTWREEALFE